MLLCAFLQSLPLRECGLKLLPHQQLPLADCVTPLAGVWIEIGVRLSALKCCNVTPLAGVWIEIEIITSERGTNICHSPCGSVD